MECCIPIVCLKTVFGAALLYPNYEPVYYFAACLLYISVQTSLYLLCYSFDLYSILTTLFFELFADET